MSLFKMNRKCYCMVAVAVCFAVNQAYAYNISNRFDNVHTASESGSGTQGDPITFTWSIVPDGTSVRDRWSGSTWHQSDLIAFMDTEYGAGDGGSDLTQRPWFSLFESSYERWDELSGISFSYEPNDDGQNITGTQNSSTGEPTFPGELGVRGDFRVSGVGIDGDGGTYAYNYYPNVSDTVIDTSGDRFMGVDENNVFAKHEQVFRNTVMHETGHGLGLNHYNPDNAQVLMQSYVKVQYDGPQIDDIVAIQRLYGDALEKNGGNDNFGRATAFGTVTADTSVSIGSDGTLDKVTFDNTDFVSIDDDSDIDFYSFELLTSAHLEVALTPVGRTYVIGENETDLSARADLVLALLDADENLVMDADINGIGEAELLSLDLMPGEYFARVTGNNNQAQLYELALNFTLIPEPACFVLLAGGALLGLSRRSGRKMERC